MVHAFLIGATTPNGLYFRDELAGSGTYRMMIDGNGNTALGNIQSGIERLLHVLLLISAQHRSSLCWHPLPAPPQRLHLLLTIQVQAIS